MPNPQAPTPALLLQTMPKNAAAAVVTLASFAVIGAVNTASFIINKTADLIAWAANDRREENWIPLFTAICILLYFTRLVLMKLLQNDPINPENVKVTQQQMEAMMESFVQKQAKAPNKLPTSEEKAFPSSTAFAKGLRRAGAKEDLFALPASSSALFSPPSNRASTRPPSPNDALLDAAFKEMEAQTSEHGHSKK